MVTFDEVKEAAHQVSSYFPVYWVAQYQDGYQNIKIPKCRKCGKYVKVLDYEQIECRCGEYDDFEWFSFELDNGILTEYNKDIVQSDISHGVLPVDRLEKLFFYIKPREILVGIDLANGEYLIDGVAVGAGVVVNRQPVAASSQLSRYDDFFVFKTCLTSVNSPERLIWYKMGYKCTLNIGAVAMMLMVHVPTLQPYFMSEIL